MTKPCPHCGLDLPATVKYYARDKRNRSGWDSWCRRCKVEQAAARRKNKGPKHSRRRGTIENQMTAAQLADHHELTEGERMVVENALGALRVGDVTPDSIVKRYVPSWVRQIRVLSVVVARARG